MSLAILLICCAVAVVVSIYPEVKVDQIILPGFFLVLTAVLFIFRNKDDWADRIFDASGLALLLLFPLAFVLGAFSTVIEKSGCELFALIAGYIVIFIIMYIRIRKAKKRELTDRLRPYYETHSLREISGMPKDTWMCDDGFPATFGVGYGERYTRYLSLPNGKTCHRENCPLSLAGCSVHVFSPSCPSNTCSLCAPDPLPDSSWYRAYCKHQQICAIHKITPKPDEPPLKPVE